MQIRRFAGTKIHGYLNFDVKFDSQMTFLTGINGSGKTTVIQSIIALISPSFFILANLEYESIAVDLIHERKRIWIEARQSDRLSTVLTTTATKETLTVKKFVADPDEPPYRITDKENDYYRELEAVFETNEVMRLIRRELSP